MANLSQDAFLQFAKRMEVLGGEIELNAVKLKAKIAEEVFQTVVFGTPADTGLARSSWILSISSPNRTRITTPHFPGNFLGIGERQNAQKAFDLAKLVLAATAPGDRIYIQNNQPYIGALNRGKSVQTGGAGFVEKAVLVGIVTALRGKLVPKRRSSVFGANPRTR